MMIEEIISVDTNTICTESIFEENFDSENVYEPCLPCDSMDNKLKVHPETIQKIMTRQIIPDREVLIIDTRYSYEYKGTSFSIS